MPCICKHKLAALANPSFVASLNATLSGLGTLPMPPLPGLNLALKHLSLPAPAPYSDSLLLAVQQLQLPKISLVAALPTLGALVNIAFICKEQLGLPLPGEALRLSAMLGSFEPGILSPLLSLNMSVLANIQAYAALALQIKALLKIDPFSVNAAVELAEAFGNPASAIHIALTLPMPQLPAGLALKLGEIAALHPLVSLAAVLGINLGSASGLMELSVAIRALLQVTLPKLSVSLDLIARIAALVQIHAAFGLFNSSLATLKSQIKLLLALNLHLPIPAINLKLGEKLPTAQQVQDVLALNLPQLAAINWQVPSSLPLLGLLPALSLIAQLKALGPVLQLKPCGSSCPLGGPGQLI